MMTAEEAREMSKNAENEEQDKEMEKIMLNIAFAAGKGEYYTIYPRIQFGRTILQLRDMGYEVIMMVMPDETTWHCVKWSDDNKDGIEAIIEGGMVQ